MSDLPKRLRIKASMIALGERISWGSDTALMEEAADVIEALSASVENHQLHMLGMARDRDQLRAVLAALRNSFPLLDDNGLDETENHCEWHIQQQRKRLHATLDDAALSAQQSAPERVSVPRDLLADLISSDHDTKIQAERALYALLASHAEGGKV